MDKISITEEVIGLRVDKALATILKDESRSHLLKLIEDGCVFVNGQSVKPSYKVQKDDVIEIDFPDPESLDLKAQPTTDMQSNLNRLPSNNNTGDSQQGDKPACAPVRTIDNQKSDIEEFLGDDKELRDTFKAFIEMRVKQRKPMTDYAKTLLVKKLRVLAEDRQGWIAILNQSIENSWQSVYPIHSNDRNNTGKPVRTPVSNAAFEGQGGEYVW